MKHNKPFWIFSFLFVLAFLFVLTASSLVWGQGIKPRKPAANQPSEEAASAENERRDKARDLYYIADKSGDVRYTGVRVKLFQADQNCNFAQVSPFKTFRSGEGVRLLVESNTAGYLYLVQRGSSGQASLLFPHPDINQGKNYLARGTELMIPGKDWFRFDQTPGVETLTVIFTRRKLDLLPYLIPPAATSAAPPAPMASSVESAVLDILQGRPRARDLVYTPEDAPAPVIATGGAMLNGIYAVNAAPANNEFAVLQLKLNHQ